MQNSNSQFSDLQKAKEAARKKALLQRRALTVQQRIERSLEIALYADQLSLPAAAKVAGFWPIRDEIDPRPLMSKLSERGAEICLPIVKGEELIFRKLGREDDLVPAGFGTYGPDERAIEVAPNVLLVPLAGFDRAGRRVGYGKGFYDRALTRLEKGGPVLAIGVGFACQELEQVPVEPHDRMLDIILTERGPLRTKTRKDIE
ncbi:5-formyltetrahydrofolate cyclo-ligase [Pseudovibrio exalbescens]|uniref:5-formyltetrahydrofolate cyclo-ligase n=1 Tax=Pseudovibrio exalbescens TaxID=197461 RepID=A0A1U7JH39_9HYPH|nr:5-formyltetrahydrofolate cyclo-ligase [Pseudovibrio exalbescens]OKL44063.1 5-formyltetrahydrofolate cyclo-ligase [Pseudovibrio exalbescens]